MRSLFYLLLVALLQSYGCSKEAQISALPEDAVILAFGDSLTYGYGVNAAQSYPAILEKLSGREVINAGVSGEESADGLKRLVSYLEEYEPDLLILCHGGNDILRKRDLSVMSANINRMIDLALEREISVILLGVPKPGLFLSSADEYRIIAESRPVIYIDELIPDILSDKALKSDTVHPNANGYRRMAEILHQTLQAGGAL